MEGDCVHEKKFIYLPLYFPCHTYIAVGGVSGGDGLDHGFKDLLRNFLLKSVTHA